jgi:hypothetical protein
MTKRKKKKEKCHLNYKSKHIIVKLGPSGENLKSLKENKTAKQDYYTQ